MSERVKVLEDGRQLRWRVGHDDPLITDPATAAIMECIGLVAGELGDEPRAASGYAALRALRREYADLLAVAKAVVDAVNKQGSRGAVLVSRSRINRLREAIARAEGCQP